MINLKNFKEAHQHYTNQRISFRLLQEQAAVLLGICDSHYITSSSSLEITESITNFLMRQPEATQDYDYLLGGAIYICETEHDLLEIHGCDFNWAEKHNGQWPNVTDIPMSWDACCYTDEATGDPEWVMFLLCWNNAGGPVYYVPKHLWVKARVDEHIQFTV